MKTKLFIALAVIFMSNTGHSQLAFGVSPGLSMNSAYFGYKMDRIVPFIGFQYFGTSADYQYEHEIFDNDLGTIVDHNHNSTAKFRLLVPNIGVKYYLKDVGDLKAHASLNISKPIITGEFIDDGDTDESVEETIAGISLWGGELSFGVEYFFDEHFSLGGEFGLRYMHVGLESSFETTVFNPLTGENVPSENTYTTKFNASPTFSRISLNFYF